MDSVAYWLGYNAYLENYPCPFEDYTKEYIEWKHGYNEARDLWYNMEII